MLTMDTMDLAFCSLRARETNTIAGPSVETLRSLVAHSLHPAGLSCLCQCLGLLVSKKPYFQLICAHEHIECNEMQTLANINKYTGYLAYTIAQLYRENVHMKHKHTP